MAARVEDRVEVVGLHRGELHGGGQLPLCGVVLAEAAGVVGLCVGLVARGIERRRTTLG
jgi:hypothetical protein